MSVFRTIQQMKDEKAKASGGDFAVSGHVLSLGKDGMFAKFAFLDDFPEAENEDGIACYYEHRIFNGKYTIVVPCFEDEEEGTCPLCEAGEKKSLRYISNVFLLKLMIDKDGQRTPCNLKGEAFAEDEWSFEDRIKVLIEGGDTDGKLIWYKEEYDTLLNRVFTYRRYRSTRVKYELDHGDKIETDSELGQLISAAQENKINLLKFLHDRRARGIKDYQEWKSGGSSTPGEQPQQKNAASFANKFDSGNVKKFKDFNV